MAPARAIGALVLDGPAARALTRQSWIAVKTLHGVVRRPQQRQKQQNDGQNCQCRSFSGTARRADLPRVPVPKTVAVVGGGLTGLTTAFYLAMFLPVSTRITVYESSDRFGGWIDSETESDGTILEAGARMVAPQKNQLRWDDMVLLEMVDLLDLVDELRVSTVPAAQYVYYPDHLVSVNPFGNRPSKTPSWLAMLSMLPQLFREPLYKNFLPSLFNVMWKSAEARDHDAKQARMALASPGKMPPDESVADYFVRRTGGYRDVTDNVMSAMMHGIYGGDVNKLSISSSPFRMRWMHDVLGNMYRLAGQHNIIKERMRRRQEHAQEHDHDGTARVPSLDLEQEQNINHHLMRGHFDLIQLNNYNNFIDIAARARLRSGGRPGWENNRFARLASVSPNWTQMGFAGGFDTLTRRLLQRLEETSNVQLIKGRPVKEIRYNETTEKVEICTNKPPVGYDKVVSTLSSPLLYKITNGNVPSLRDEHAVTIQVVNLHYAETGLNRPYSGFGYLIPQSVPFEENPEGALGVIFDTDRETLSRPVHKLEVDRPKDMPYAEVESVLAELEEKALSDLLDSTGTASPTTSSEDASSSSGPGTTFTVMLGGHLWDHYTEADYPTPEDAVYMADAVVRRHLGTIPQDLLPVSVRTKLCRGCIPQHYVNHATVLARADADLNAAYRGRLAVAGGSFTATGPGVLPSLRSARDISLRVAHENYNPDFDPKELQGQGVDMNAYDMGFVGDTGLGQFADPSTDPMIPLPKRPWPMRKGMTTVFDEERQEWIGMTKRE